MKIQDIIFFVILLILIWRRDPKIAVIIGLSILLVTIPLFASWTFFTAERLTWYAAAFFLLAIILGLLQKERKI